MSLPPGPGSPRAVQTYHWLRRPTEFLTECAARYGEIFTIGAYMDGPFVMTSNPEAIQQIFAATYEDMHQPKDDEFGRLLGRGSLFILEGQGHRRMRRFIMPTMSPERMKGITDSVRLAVEEALDSWPIGTRFSLQHAMQDVLMKTTLDMLLGPHCGERSRALGRLFSGTYVEFASPLMMLPIHYQTYLGRGPWVRIVELARQARAILTDEITERRAKKQPPGNDVLSMLLQTRDATGEALTDDELRDSIITLFVAGHDTTANALSWAFTCLLENPAAHRRLVEELRGAAKNGVLSDEQIASLPFLEATVREVLRLRPIFPGTTRTLRQPLRLLGYDLPIGTRVAPSIYLVQRRPEIFPEPDRFLPERFLQPRPLQHDFIPFGGGMRRCVGGASVSMQMKMILATCLLRAELRAVPGPNARTVRAFISLAPSGGVPAVLTARAPRTQRRAAPSVSLDANHLRTSST